MTADAADPPNRRTSPGASDGPSDVPAPTLFMGVLTAVAAGGFVGWALVPLSTTVAGAPLFAVAAVATTLWSGLSFLRRELPSGVLAEGFYLMGVAVLSRPASVILSLDGLPAFLEQPGVVFVTVIVAVVVASLLFVAGWRLDTRARKMRLRRMRRRVGRRMSNHRAASGPLGTGTSGSDSSSSPPKPRSDAPDSPSERSGNPDQ